MAAVLLPASLEDRSGLAQQGVLVDHASMPLDCAQPA